MVETDRAAVIKLFQAGQKQKQILNLLKMPNGRSNPETTFCDGLGWCVSTKDTTGFCSSWSQN